MMVAGREAHADENGDETTMGAPSSNMQSGNGASSRTWVAHLSHCRSLLHLLPPNQPSPKPFLRLCRAWREHGRLVCRRSFPPNADSTCSRGILTSRLASGLSIAPPPPYTGEYIHDGGELPKSMSARTNHPDFLVSNYQNPRTQSYRSVEYFHT
jgi:hypothetical protein